MLDFLKLLSVCIFFHICINYSEPYYTYRMDIPFTLVDPPAPPGVFPTFGEFQPFIRIFKADSGGFPPF